MPRKKIMFAARINEPTGISGVKATLRPAGFTADTGERRGAAIHPSSDASA
jgi:hypothetical protein